MKGKNRVSLWSRREVEEEKEVVFSEKVLCKNSSLSLSLLYLGLPLSTCLCFTWNRREQHWCCSQFEGQWKEINNIHTQFLHLKYHMSLNLCPGRRRKADKNRAKTRCWPLHWTPKTEWNIWEGRGIHAALWAIWHETFNLSGQKKIKNAFMQLEGLHVCWFTRFLE